MKNLETFMNTMKHKDSLTVKYLVGDVLGKYHCYTIQKYNAEDGNSNFCITKKGSYDSYNVASISRGGLNLYTFDIFDNKLTVRIKLKDLELIAVSIGENTTEKTI
jgi:hypothetical protein